MSINIGDLLGGLTGGDKEKSGGGGGGNLVAMVLPALTGLLAGGGLQKLLGGLQAKGLTSEVDSWQAKGGDNKPVSAADIKDVMGDDELSQVASQANVSKDEAADAISQLLPKLVDKASPEGQLPDQDGLSGLLGSLGKQLGG
ncbi:MAG TPA: YidB family protein [Acidimicrobiales bacterium]|nr:YidB family protein [Acidimicrobiales bacterium]